MDLLQSLVLGIVQGATEFLPISSTAHLVLVPYFFGWKDPGLAFDVALHLGTFLAVAWYFWRDFLDLGYAWFESFRAPRLREDAHQRLAWFIVVACIPGGLAGILLEDAAAGAFRDPALIGAALVFFAIVLGVAERIGKRALTEKEMTWKHALAVGFAQAIAIIPGASRSGVTITAGLFAGLTRDAAARFSFLLGTPIVFGAVVYQAKDFMGAASAGWLPIGIGVASSAVTGYLCIKFLIAYLRQRTTGIFIAYRFILGGALIAMALTGQMPRNGTATHGAADGHVQAAAVAVHGVPEAATPRR